MEKHDMMRQLFCAVTIAIAAVAVAEAQTRPVGRVIFDDDGNSNCLMNRMWNGAPLTTAMVDSCVNIQAATQVTTYAICAGSDFFNYRSALGRTFGDDLGGSLAGGCDSAALRNMRTAYGNHLRLESAGTDIIRRSLSQARRKGMETMLTMRMNDLHFTDLSLGCPIYFSEWWLRHPQFLTNDSTQGWHSAGAYDFAHEEVRKRKIACAEEQLRLYGDIVDIYLLDFMRFFCYFKSGEGVNHCDEMTQMVRRIRQIADSVGRAKGRRISLAARVAPTISDNLRNGLDVRRWVKEGLLDFVCAGIHTVLDPNMPVAKLRREFGGDLNIPLYVSNDIAVYNEFEPISEGMMRGFFSNMYDQGADGIMLFNYYFHEYNAIYHGAYHVEKGGMTCRTPHPRMLKELGSPATLEGRNKIYWLSDGKSQYGMHPATPLPLEMTAGETKSVDVNVGDKMKQGKPREVILFLRTVGDAAVEVSLNDVPAIEWRPEYIDMYDKRLKTSEGDRCHAVVLPATAVRHGVNTITFKSKNHVVPFVIKRMELALKYGDVDGCGYF